MRLGLVHAELQKSLMQSRTSKIEFIFGSENLQKTIRYDINEFLFRTQALILKHIYHFDHEGSDLASISKSKIQSNRSPRTAQKRTSPQFRSLQSGSEAEMSDNEFSIDYKWLMEKLEREKKGLKIENDRLDKENKALRAAVSKLFERLSAVSGSWRPAAAQNAPKYDNLCDEGASGTFGSVVALCERDPSLLKKFNNAIHLLLLESLLFLVHASHTKPILLTFFFQRDATQTSPQTMNTNGHPLRPVLFVDHLKQRSSSSNQAPTSIRQRVMDGPHSSLLLPGIKLKLRNSSSKQAQMRTGSAMMEKALSTKHLQGTIWGWSGCLSRQEQI
jgi:hypothetical protein